MTRAGAWRFLLLLLVSSTAAADAGRLRVKILAINDFHGQLSTGRRLGPRPAGGAAILASYLAAASRGIEDHTLIVHAGDLVGASAPESGLLQDEPSVMFMNMLANPFCSCGDRMNPRCNLVGTVGNHELDEGDTEMLRLVNGGNHASGPYFEDPWRGAVFPYVCANVVEAASGRPLFPPYLIKIVDSVPIGFVGAVTKESATQVNPARIGRLRFLDEADAINAAVAELRQRNVRSIVILLHQGGSQEPYEGPTDPARKGPTGAVVPIVERLRDDVDLVVTGHTHTFINAFLPGASGKKILVTQAYSRGMAYADIDIEIDRGTHDVAAASARIVPVYADDGPGLKPLAAVAALVARAGERVKPITSRVAGTAAHPVLRLQNDNGESALGDLIADAMCASAGADFAFMNPGGIRTDLDAGEVTWGELYTVMPFGNTLIRMELTGQQIYELLDRQWTVASYPRVLQVSGLTYTWDAALPRAHRVTEVLRDRTPIDRRAVYTAVVPEFLAAGGDGFSTFSQGGHATGGALDVDAMATYIRSLPQPFSPAASGRIHRAH